MKRLLNRTLVRIEFLLIDLEGLCSLMRTKIKSYRWEHLERINYDKS